MKYVLLGAFAATAIAASAQAATIDLTTMNLNGDASLVGSAIQLTPAQNSKNGSAFINSAYALGVGTTFSAAFELSISNNGFGGADGITFTVQNDTNGANQQGSLGGGIGYQGISPSVAVEFDTWNNGSVDGNSNNHVGINQNGSLASVALANPGFTLQDASSIFAWVDYDGTTLDVYVSNSATQPGAALLSENISLAGLGGQGYFGFTSATGGANSLHMVKSFDLTVNNPAAVPLPAAIPLMGTAFGIMGLIGLRRRKQA